MFQSKRVIERFALADGDADGGADGDAADAGRQVAVVNSKADAISNVDGINIAMSRTPSNLFIYSTRVLNQGFFKSVGFFVSSNMPTHSFSQSAS